MSSDSDKAPTVFIASDDTETVDIAHLRTKSADVNTFVEISDYIYQKLGSLKGVLARRSQE